MRCSVSLPLTLLVCAALAPVARAAPAHNVDVGIGEQSPALFSDARFRATGIGHARLIVPYDVVRAGGEQLAYTDAWLSAARDRGVEALVTFGHSNRSRRQKRRLPSVREYAARVREFRARFPWVRTFATWNEANHTVQPTGRDPRRTARFYRELRRQCPQVAGCTVVAVEVLLTHSWRTWRWIRRFRQRAGRGPHLWGLHNYPDVTRLRVLNTRLFLRRVPRGEVWFTETGGVVRFAKSWPFDERRAARAVRHSFRLAARYPRVKRMYFYNWLASSDNSRWDSGFIANGVERRAYAELLDGLALPRFRPPPPPVTEAEPPDEPVPVTDEDD